MSGERGGGEHGLLLSVDVCVHIVKSTTSTLSNIGKRARRGLAGDRDRSVGRVKRIRRAMGDGMRRVDHAFGWMIIIN
jgi:hypothetical protein